MAQTDEVDGAIIEGLKPWNVTQRIRRMNKKLDNLIGQKIAEKVGKGWALTTFLREACFNPFRLRIQKII